MSTKPNFRGAIGAWIDSELHPPGATSPSSPNSDFVSMRLNNVYETLDYLNIAWFGIDMTNPKQPTIKTGNTGLSMIVTDARNQNSNIKIFGTLAWTSQILSDLQTIISDPTVLNNFATNIATFLGNNHMNGFDIDWEPPISSLKPTQCAAWLNALRKAFGSTYFISISPSTTMGLDATAVNNNCNIINIQSYAGISPSAFTSIGITPSLLGFGAKFETQGSAPFQNAYQAYKQYIAGFTANGNSYSYNTICTWRMDSGNWSFEQGQQLLLSQYIKEAPSTVPFNDGTIISAQTTPTLMKTVTVWNGEVVDAIQTSNQNHAGTYVVEMLQHGGDTGRQNPSINLPNGLTHLSYVTGDWYGNHVIVQITIAGNNYPAAISPSVSNTVVHSVQAPAGKTIVAFKGSSQYVLLAGGGFTWVLSDIDPIFG
ncbi:MAG: glycosyl hydrolase family 18 protein [Chitinophagales bacterium]|nr:glycosyl hydrolase family 18 protein [Chitinophagales bacterium]